MMLVVSMRDLQFRLRRFLVSILAVALVFGLSLVLTGVSISFDVEIDRTLDHLAADGYVGPAAASGPFFGAVPMLQATVDQIAALPGVRKASPLAYRPMTINAPVRRGVNVFGFEPSGIGQPAVVEGVAPTRDDEVAIDRRAGLLVGETFVLSGKTMKVAGIVDRATLLAGGADVFVTLKTFQALAFGGQPIITTVAFVGSPTSVPPEFRMFDNAAAHKDLLDPIATARTTIYMVMGLLWIVAAAIVASVVYLSASERMSEFAVFKAIGVSSKDVVGGLVLQSAILALAAVGFAVVIAYLLLPIFPLPVEIPLSAISALGLVGMAVGGLASIAAVRKALAVDPAIAFG